MSEAPRGIGESTQAIEPKGTGPVPVEPKTSTGDAIIILVDASNVAYGSGSSGKPQLDFLNRMLAHLGSYPVKVVALADATLRHSIDRKEELQEMLKSGQVEQVPAGTSADDFLWQLWKNYIDRGERAYIVTNDHFAVENARQELMPLSPRIAFFFLGSDLILRPSIDTLFRQGLDSTESSPVVKPGPPSLSASDTTIGFPTQGSPLVPNGTEVPQMPWKAPTDSLPPAALKPTLREVRRETRVAADLVDATIRVMARYTEPIGGVVRKVNFATIAHDLHNQYGGDFVTKFGLKRPKDLAMHMADADLLSISFKDATMYVEPTPHLESLIQQRALDRYSPLEKTEAEVDSSRSSGARGFAGEAGSAAATEPPVIEVTAGAPSPTVEVDSPEVFLRLVRDHRPQHIFHWPCAVYENQYGSPHRREGEFFFVASGTAYRLPGRAYRTLDDFIQARFHGFKGADHPSLIGSEDERRKYDGQHLTKIWEEVRDFSQLGYQSGMRPLEGDVYYCAQASGFSDLSGFLADRSKKEKERPYYI